MQIKSNIDKIIISGVECPIKYYEAGDMGGDLGQFYTNPLEIRIDKSLPKTERLQTLCHEIIEFINWQFSLGLSHSKIEIIANVFYQLNKIRLR